MPRDLARDALYNGQINLWVEDDLTRAYLGALWNALQASRYQNRGLEATVIEARMLSKSEQLCWWAACRDVIAELKQRFRDSFVPDPKQSVIDEATARAHICGSPWFRKLATEAGRSSEADVHALLRASDHPEDGPRSWLWAKQGVVESAV